VLCQSEGAVMPSGICERPTSLTQDSPLEHGSDGTTVSAARVNDRAITVSSIALYMPRKVKALELGEILGSCGRAKAR